MDITRQKLIFVTGASRSGTTLLSFVLRNNSEVMGLKELQFFGEFWDPRNGAVSLPWDKAVAAAAMMFARQDHGVMSAIPDADDLARAENLIERLGPDGTDPAAIFAEIVAQFAGEAGKIIPCEQTPRNIYYARALLDIYPNSRVVHMMRDPRAVMASQKQRWMRRKLSTDKSEFPRSRTFRAWVNYHPFTISKLWNRASQEAAKLKNHPRFTVVKFEDLLTEPEPTLKHLCARLNLDYQEAMLEVGQINSSHESSVGGAKTGFNAKTIEAWRNKLSAGEIRATEQRCSAMMRANGYDSDAGPGGFLRSLWLRVTYLFHLAGVVALNPRRAWIQFKGLTASDAQPAATVERPRAS